MAIRFVFHLELTDKCNFNCTYCKSVRRQNNAMLDFDVALKCMDVIRDNPIHGVYLNSVQFNGSGEALLYPRLDEVITEARKRFSMAEFITNAYLLTEERIVKLLETNIDMIEISLTGIKPEIYQHFQGSGISYDKCIKQLECVINNVKNLAKKRDEMKKHTYIRLRYIRSREFGSYYHLKEYVNFWKNTGIDEIFVTALWDFSRKQTKKDKIKIIRCHCMNSPMKVNADGNVFSCANNHDTSRYSFGNVNDIPLENIITNSDFITDKANKMTVDLNKVPKTCLSCEGRTLRNFFEESQNMRKKIFLKKPIKNIIYNFLGISIFGIVVMCYERFNRSDIFHKFFWYYMCKQTKKIHDEFHLNKNRTCGESKIYQK